MMDLNSDVWSGFRAPSQRMERCLLGNEEIQLPELLIEQGNIFSEVLSQETWDSVVTDAHREKLMKLLPKFTENDAEEKQETVRRLFSGEDFKFGNPLSQFQNKLRDGYLSPDIAKYSSLCKQYKYREYKFRQQRYYSDLLKDVILAKQQVLEEVNHMAPDVQIKIDEVPTPTRDRSMDHKVKKKYIRLLKDVREECGVEETSSEEEEESVSPVQRSRRQLFKSLGPIPSPEPTIPSVLATFASKPVAVNGDIAGSALPQAKRQRPISPVEITEEDYHMMLLKHKKKKADNADLLELDTQSVTLQDILTRCQANRKISKSPSGTTSQVSPVAKKKLKARDREDRKLKNKIKSEPDSGGKERIGSPMIDSGDGELEVSSDLLQRDEGGVPDFPLPETGSKLGSFFSLLRDLISEYPDQRVSTAKLEERVREWQESPSSSLNSWFLMQTNWVDAVQSALKFLSGDVLGLTVENFIPFLDYKERAQHWKWIGEGRDSNLELSPLSQYWLQHKDDGLADRDMAQGSPLPLKSKTAFVVRPTSDEEKATFQEQEKQRFDSPHKAFIYRLHGYESVVGPVKGVYSKDSAMTKAREHTLLVSERPPFVTILTLVRDAAARLPNGEGTRGDICELLKDSQFLASNVTDTQINTVVSGALDRLHSEKDPCVKYEVNRKLWIYLHRSRTIEEFERIHQAQGAAVKAKKSLQKPKTPKVSHSKDSAQTLNKTTTTASVLTSNENIIVDDLTSSTIVTTPGSKTLAHAAFPAGLRTAQMSPVKSTTSPKTVGAALGLTGSIGHLSSSASSDTVAHSTMKTTAALLKTQTTSSLAAGLPKAVTCTMVTAAGLPSAIVTSLAQGKTETLITRAQALNMGLLGTNVIRQTSAISAALGNCTTLQSVGGKSETILHKPTARAVHVSSVVTSSGSPSVTSIQNISAQAGLVSTPTTKESDSATVARLIQQVSSPHMVGNLLTSQNQRVQVANPRTTTIKIQGGNVIQPVGGKLSVGGKPVHLSSAQFAHAKGLVQLGGKNAQPLSLIQTPQGTLSAINIVPQSTTTRVVTLSQSNSVMSVASSTVNTGLVGTAGIPLEAVLNQTKLGNAVSAAQSYQGVQQPKVVTAAQQGGIVVTQLAPGSITLRPGAGQTKGVSVGQTGLIPQFIVQQASPSGKTGDGSTTSVSQDYRTPILLSNAGGKGGQNIQVVRTVLSQQAGLKPGQATILISQPALQGHGNMVPPGQVLQAATSKSSGRGSPKGKAQPVYARIITPPPGMKLATVGAGQTLQQNFGVIQTVGKILQNVTTSGFTPVVSSGVIQTGTPIVNTSTAENATKNSEGNG